MFHFIKEIYLYLGLSDMNAEVAKSATLLMLIFILAIIINFIVRKIIIHSLHKIAKKTSIKYDDILLEQKVFLYITHLIPAIVIHLLLKYVFDENTSYNFDYQEIINFINSVLELYVYVIIWAVSFAFINALHEIYKNTDIAKRVDIKGFLQLIKVLISIIFIILIISVLIDKKPGAVLAAFGAVAAALIFVFKDILLGFVAGIQIAANQMVKPGDWISMPDMNADGTVLEIGLTTCKIQNWDKTISTVPTYMLVSKSFANWRGMEESGGRRIKRSLYIDAGTIKFCDKKMIERFKEFHLLKTYIQQKELEIAEYNQKHNLEEGNSVNARRITNIGTFRKYIEHYLKEHPKLRKDMTILVRQLQVTPNGLPLEIYVFSADQRWIQYEAIQSDIFDHIFAIIHEFDLKLFQNPSGNNFEEAFSHLAKS
jgi:miniconductance mechanosensitive channel